MNDVIALDPTARIVTALIRIVGAATGPKAESLAPDVRRRDAAANIRRDPKCGGRRPF